MNFTKLPKGIYGEFKRRFSFWDKQVNESWLSIDTHYKGLTITAVIANSGLLTPTPTNGQSYVTSDNYIIHTWFESVNNGSWVVEPLNQFEIFYDLGNAGFYYFNGSNIIPVNSNTDLFPAGKRIVFYEPVAPLGWSLYVPVTDCFLRVNNAGGGVTGGIWSDLNHNHAMPHTHTHSHTHSYGTYAAKVMIGGEGIQPGDPDNVYIGAVPMASWSSSNNIDASNPQANVSGFTRGAGVTGTSGGASNNTTSNPNNANTSNRVISHGSTDHKYADVIIVERDA